MVDALQAKRQVPQWTVPKKTEVLKPMSQQELAASKRKPKREEPEPEAKAAAKSKAAAKPAGKKPAAGVKKKPAASKAAAKPKTKAKAKERGTDYGKANKAWKENFMKAYPGAPSWKLGRRVRSARPPWRR